MIDKIAFFIIITLAASIYFLTVSKICKIEEISFDF